MWRDSGIANRMKTPLLLTPLLALTALSAQTPPRTPSSVSYFRQQLLRDASVSEVAFAPAGDAVAYLQSRPMEATRQKFGDFKVADLWGRNRPRLEAAAGVVANGPAYLGPRTPFGVGVLGRTRRLVS